MSYLGIIDLEDVGSDIFSNVLNNKEEEEENTDTIMLIIIVVILSLIFYYLFFDNKDNKEKCGRNAINSFNSAITNLGLIAILTVFTATIAAPGKLTKLYADNKLFRFIYFYLVIYILADQSFHGGISYLFALVATVVILFIYDLLSEPGDGYTPFFFRNDEVEIKKPKKCKKNKKSKKNITLLKISEK